MIVADDSTRVILSYAHKKHSDYINASWINASSHLWKLNIHFSIAYRATRKKNLMWLVKVCAYLSTFNVHAIQCVLIRATARDSWELLAHGLADKDTNHCLQVKCEQYWPERVGEAITVDGGRLIVHLNEVVPFADYELRKLTVYCVSHKTSQK